MSNLFLAAVAICIAWIFWRYFRRFSSRHPDKRSRYGFGLGEDALSNRRRTVSEAKSTLLNRIRNQIDMPVRGVLEDYRRVHRLRDSVFQVTWLDGDMLIWCLGDKRGIGRAVACVTLQVSYEGKANGAILKPLQVRVNSFQKDCHILLRALEGAIKGGSQEVKQIETSLEGHLPSPKDSL